MDRRVRGREAVAADGTCERSGVLSAVCVLPVTIPCRVAFEDVPVAVCCAGNLGRDAGNPIRADSIRRGGVSGRNGNVVDDTVVANERGLDSELGAELAGVVHGGDGVAETSGRTVRRGRKLERIIPNPLCGFSERGCASGSRYV